MITKDEVMQIAVKNKDIFPVEVRELLHAFYSAEFFKESILIGSWVMPLYQEAFGINYTLRTLDIDFAVKFVYSDRDKKIDLEQCSIIAQQLVPERLKTVVDSLKSSKKTQKALLTSCEAIDFPPLRLGLQ